MFDIEHFFMSITNRKYWDSINDARERFIKYMRQNYCAMPDCIKQAAENGDLDNDADMVYFLRALFEGMRQADFEKIAKKTGLKYIPSEKDASVGLNTADYYDNVTDFLFELLKTTELYKDIRYSDIRM